MGECECGCGKTVKSGKRFVWGHNRFRPGLPAWNRGISPSEATREKMRRSGGKMKGYHHTEETKERLRKNHSGMRGKKHSPETIQKMREAQKKSAEFGRKVQEKLQGHPVSEETKEKIRLKRKFQICSDVTRQKMSESLKGLWKSGKVAKRFHIKPNKPETVILNLLNVLYPDQWKYTGDFSVIINGKNPDFIDRNNKKIIEVFGDYWHKGEDPQDRADIFKPFGYQTLVVWESELSDLETVKQTINDFVAQ